MYDGGCLVTTLHTFMKMYLFYHGNVGKILYVFRISPFSFFFRGDVCWYLFNSDIYWVKMNLRNKHKKDMTFQMVKMLHKLLIKSFNYVFFSFSHLFHNLFNIIKEKRKTEKNGKAFNNFHTTFHCFSTFNLCAD